MIIVVSSMSDCRYVLKEFKMKAQLASAPRDHAHIEVDKPHMSKKQWV